MIDMTLCITEAGRPARRIAMANTLTIGRDTDNTIVLAAHTVSRYHAMLFRDSSGWLLVDLESTNGTLVNGVALPLEEPVRLIDGDVIQFGQAVARYIAI
jgi:pSer/pThr/pTyr-binding forkhead associated (FHA) protein